MNPNMDPMAPKVTTDERDRIIELIRTGKSANEIAKTTGRSNDTVCRIASDIGWTFGQSNVARAQEARSGYAAERRAEIAVKATQRMAEVLERMEGRYLAFNFGGKDNTYAEHELDEPPVEAVRAMAATVRDLAQTVIAIDKHDNAAAGDVGARGLLERLIDSLEDVAAAS